MTDTSFNYRAAFELGHNYARFVAECLIDAGVSAELPALEFAENEADRERFTLHEKDVITPAGVLEVKSSSRVFGAKPFEYPYPSLIVDTLHGYVKKARKPVAYCIVSQTTNAIVVVPVSTQQFWRVEDIYDKQRLLTAEMLICDKQYLRSFSELVTWLKNKTVLHPTDTVQL